MRGVLAGAVVLMLAGCSAGDSASWAARATVYQPGSSSIGDPYFPASGNGGYDVRGYDLKLAYDPAAGRLDGTATITATATQNLSRLSLDLTGLTVSTVTVNSQPATSTATGGKLAITPAIGIARGQSFTASIRYGGRPAATPGGGWRTSRTMSYVRSAPTSAATWFPANDHPSDKATFAMEITVPKAVAAIGNGLNKGHDVNRGKATWRWAESTPIATYQAYVAIGKYRITTTKHKGKPVIIAVPRSLPAKGAETRALGRTGEIADWFEHEFGAYPFPAYGATVVDDPDLGIALAAPTGLAPDDTAVIARAVAHQWFGASVTISRWRDIWLSEGFATYAQWLWTEHDGGRSVDDVVRDHYSTYPWQVLPAADPGPEDLYSPGPYERGAMALHALRRLIGNDAFFKLLRSWVSDHAHGNATTGQFIAAAEKVSGEQLDDFFDVWLNGPYRPTY